MITIWSEPTKKELARIPPLYTYENSSAKDIQIYEHFFMFSSDWYIAEFDGRDTMFGYAILNNDFQNAEWGYISYRELKDLNVSGFQVDREKNWKVKKASEIERIIKSCGV